MRDRKPGIVIKLTIGDINCCKRNLKNRNLDKKSNKDLFDVMKIFNDKSFMKFKVIIDWGRFWVLALTYHYNLKSLNFIMNHLENLKFFNIKFESKDKENKTKTCRIFGD